MQSADKQWIGVGLIIGALVLMRRRNQNAATPFQRDPEAIGWGYIRTPGNNSGSGGLITTGISYTQY